MDFGGSGSGGHQRGGGNGQILCGDSSSARSQSWRELLGSLLMPQRQQEQACSPSGAFLVALPFISSCPFLSRRVSALSSQAWANPFCSRYGKVRLQQDARNSCKWLREPFQALAEQRQKISLNRCCRHALQSPIFGIVRERSSVLDKSKDLLTFFRGWLL